MRVFVAGATGVVGRPLVRQLREAGHDVTALTRTEQGAAALRELGASPVVADVFDQAAVNAAVAGADAVVHQLTAIAARIRPRKIGVDFAPTNRLRTEGTRILLAAAKAAGVKRFVAQSISFVTAPDGPIPSSEDEPLYSKPSWAAMVDAVRDLEAQVSAGGGIALRYGSFYGPGTVYGEGGSLRADVMRRRVPVVGDGAGVFSFCHVEDAAGATLAALAGGAPGVYNIVDDDPSPSREWIPAYAQRLGAKPPMHVPRAIARIAAGAYGIYLMCEQRAASNAKAKQTLGWKPRHPSWRELLSS